MKIERRPSAAEVLAMLVLLSAIAMVAGLLAWLLGPFGPTLRSTAMKWVVTSVDFVALAVVIFLFAGQTEWIHDAVSDLENWLETKFDKGSV